MVSACLPVESEELILRTGFPEAQSLGEGGSELLGAGRSPIALDVAVVCDGWKAPCTQFAPLETNRIINQL